MMNLVERTRRALDSRCLVKGGLSKDGCKVVMTDVPSPKLIIDFDKPGSPLEADETRCDYLLIAAGEHAHGWVVVLELKRGRLNADEVARQLRAGASAAEKRILKKRILQNEPVRFRPVVVSGSTSKHERNLLKKKSNAVRFHGHTETIQRVKCGAPLFEELRRPPAGAH